LPKLIAITSAKEREIEALWALTFGNSFIDEIPVASFSCTVSSITPAGEEWLGREHDQHIGSVQIFGTSAFDLFGQVIEVHNVENILSDVELVEVLEISPTSRRLKFVGSGHAKWLRRVRQER
jgi:hypothetical protein